MKKLLILILLLNSFAIQAQLLKVPPYVAATSLNFTDVFLVNQGNNVRVANLTQLSTLLGAGGGSSAFVFTTVSLLRTSTSANPSIIYYVTDPGKEGAFKYVSGDVSSTDNLGLTLVSGNGLRYQRIYQGPVSVTWFGAVPDYDSIADTGTPNATAFRSALLYGNYNIFIPGGGTNCYKIESQVWLRNVAQKVTINCQQGVQIFISVDYYSNAVLSGYSGRRGVFEFHQVKDIEINNVFINHRRSTLSPAAPLRNSKINGITIVDSSQVGALPTVSGSVIINNFNLRNGSDIGVNISGCNEVHITGGRVGASTPYIVDFTNYAYLEDFTAYGQDGPEPGHSTATSTYGGEGIQCGHIQHLRAKNLAILNTTDSGFNTYGVADASVTNCFFDNIGKDGLKFLKGSTPFSDSALTHSRRIYVAGCKFNGFWDSRTDGGSMIKVEECIGDVIIVNNTLLGKKPVSATSGEVGITVTGNSGGNSTPPVASRIILQGNIIKDTRDYAINAINVEFIDVIDNKVSWDRTNVLSPIFFTCAGTRAGRNFNIIDNTAINKSGVVVGDGIRIGTPGPNFPFLDSTNYINVENNKLFGFVNGIYLFLGNQIGNVTVSNNKIHKTTYCPVRLDMVAPDTFATQTMVKKITIEDNKVIDGLTSGTDLGESSAGFFLIRNHKFAKNISFKNNSVVSTLPTGLIKPMLRIGGDGTTGMIHMIDVDNNYIDPRYNTSIVSLSNVRYLRSHGIIMNLPPTFGSWRLGDQITNNSYSVGYNKTGWICTKAGEFNSNAWASTSAYIVGDRVYNGTNTYECTKAGTSATSGGPSGTGLAITDGTVTWMYSNVLNPIFTSYGDIGIDNSRPFTDSIALLRNNAVPSKILKFDLSAQSSGATRVITTPDANCTLPCLALPNIWTNNQTFNSGINTFNSKMYVKSTFTLDSTAILNDFVTISPRAIATSTATQTGSYPIDFNSSSWDTIAGAVVTNRWRFISKPSTSKSLFDKFVIEQGGTDLVYFDNRVNSNAGISWNNTNFYLKNTNGAVKAQFVDAGTSTVNWPRLIASVSGSPVTYASTGSDSNIPNLFAAKGTGTNQFQGSGIMLRNGATVTSTGNQRPSYKFSFQTANWSGSAEVLNTFDIYSNASLASNGVNTLTFQYNGGSALMTLTNAGVVGIPNLSGTGTRTVIVDASGNLSTQVGNISTTATLDFPSTTGQTNSDLTISLPGALVGETVVLGVPNGSVTTNSSFSTWVSAADVITVRYNNYDVSSNNPASGTFKVTVVR